MKLQVPPGYQFVETYFVFDVKMDLTRKARLVARGSMTEATKEDTFASVVSRDTVRLFFLLVALNDLDVLSYRMHTWPHPIKKRCGRSSQINLAPNTRGGKQSSRRPYMVWGQVVARSETTLR